MGKAGMFRIATFALGAIVVAAPAAPATAKTFPTETGAVEVTRVVGGLEHPWALAFLPDGAMLVTERPGRLRLIENGELRPERVAGVPAVMAEGQGGLLDVALDPDFAITGHIFLSYSEPGEAGSSGTAVARARLVRDDGGARLEDLAVIFRQNLKTRSAYHYGSRLAFAPDKTLYVTIGERGAMNRAQDPSDHAGSVVRITRDGAVPADNPYADGKAARPDIWSIGHRNPQGATIQPGTGRLWTVEHGPRGGDELNAPQAGRNYGWPVIGYGVHYSGERIGVGPEKAGLEQPVHYWDPSIAPSGLAFYSGDLFPEWRGNLFVGALKFQLLARLVLDGDRVVHEERLLRGAYGRIRDVRAGPDGALYLLTDEDPGELLRLAPAR